MKWSLLVGAAAVAVGPCIATPPPRAWVDYTEGGDCVIKVQARGDAFNHWVVTQDLYSLCTKEDGLYFRLDDGECSDEKLTCDNQTPSFDVKKNVPGSKSKRNWAEKVEREAAVSKSYVEKQLDAMRENMIEAVEAAKEGRPPVHGRGRKLATTTMKNLVLMIRWSDHAAKLLPSVGDLDILMNSAPGHPSEPVTGSIKTYYLDQSNGQLQVDSVLTDWIDVSFSEADAAGALTGSGPCNGGIGNNGNCANDLHAAIREAINTWEASFAGGFAQFDSDSNTELDMLTILHSGFGAEGAGGASFANFWIWSHKFVLFQGASPQSHVGPVSNLKYFRYNISPSQYGVSGNNMARIGVIAHEMAHYLGLPDLYDTDYSSSGLGWFDIMADSWGYNSQQTHPGSFSPMSKIMLGWLTPTVISGGPGFENSTMYNLTSFQETHQVLAMALTNDDLSLFSAADWQKKLSGVELLLIENRRSIGVDQWGTQGNAGVLIWHIDYGTVFESCGLNCVTINNEVNKFELDVSQPNTWADTHYGIRLVQADHLFELENGGQSDVQDYFIPGKVFGEASVIKAVDYANAAAGLSSGHNFHDFSAPGFEITFNYTYDLSGGITASPTNAPEGPPDESILDFFLNLSLVTQIAIGVGAFLLITTIMVGAARSCSSSPKPRQPQYYYQNNQLAPVSDYNKV